MTSDRILVTCPICRSTYEVPKDGFPCNHFLCNLVEIYDTQQEEEIPCTYCQYEFEENTATSRYLPLVVSKSVVLLSQTSQYSSASGVFSSFQYLMQQIASPLRTLRGILFFCIFLNLGVGMIKAAITRNDLTWYTGPNQLTCSNCEVINTKSEQTVKFC